MHARINGGFVIIITQGFSIVLLNLRDETRRDGEMRTFSITITTVRQFYVQITTNCAIL